MPQAPGSYIGLQSFLYKPNLINSSTAFLDTYKTSFHNWTCATQFIGIALDHGSIIQITTYLAWREQHDDINSCVRDNWFSISWIQFGRLLNHLRSFKCISQSTQKILLYQHVVSTRKHHANVFRIARHFPELIALLGPKVTCQILINSLYEGFAKLYRRLFLYWKTVWKPRCMRIFANLSIINVGTINLSILLQIIYLTNLELMTVSILCLAIGRKCLNYFKI